MKRVAAEGTAIEQICVDGLHEHVRYFDCHSERSKPYRKQFSSPVYHVPFRSGTLL